MARMMATVHVDTSKIRNELCRRMGVPLHRATRVPRVWPLTAKGRRSA